LAEPLEQDLTRRQGVPMAYPQLGLQNKGECLLVLLLRKRENPTNHQVVILMGGNTVSLFLSVVVGLT